MKITLMVLVGLLLWVSRVEASLYNISKPAETAYQRPEDMLALIPFLSQIPRSFLLGDGFKVKMSGQSLRIDHMGYRSQAQGERRNCMVGFSYVTPVAGFFTSRIDLPLFHSTSLTADPWAMNTLGDYVVQLSRQQVEHASIRLTATAKF